MAEKRRKTMAETTEEQTTDRISGLPDEILIKILSAANLDTKTAIQTSLLSRPWQNLWKSVLWNDWQLWNSKFSEALTTLRLYRCVLHHSPLSGPNLTDLEVIKCKFGSRRSFIISGAKLVRIVLVHSNGLPSYHPNVEIHASNLKSFTCKGLDPARFTSWQFQSFECLDFDVYFSTTWQASLDCVCMLRSFRKAERVKLHVNAVMALAMFLDLLEEQESPFKRLSCLELHNSRRVLSSPRVFNTLISYFFDQAIPKTAPLDRIFASDSRNYDDSCAVVVRKSDLMA